MDYTQSLLNSLGEGFDNGSGALHFSGDVTFRVIQLSVGYLLTRIDREWPTNWIDLEKLLAEATDLYMVSADLKKVTRISADELGTSLDPDSTEESKKKP